MMKNRNIEKSDQWATPQDFYQKLDQEFKFDFDPCPIDYDGSPENDGLLIEWGKSNFVNPPYSRMLKEAFVHKALDVSRNGALCVLLLPVSTSTKLFHETIQPNAKEIRFLKGRIKFEGINTFGERVTNKCGMFDSMLCIFYGRQKK